MTVEPASLLAVARGAAAEADVLVCEGVGGLMVPLTSGYLVRDLAVDLALPLVVAAGAGLGTINHTLLTVEAARAAGLTVAGVVFTPWLAQPEGIEISNRETVERRDRCAGDRSRNHRPAIAGRRRFGAAAGRVAGSGLSSMVPSGRFRGNVSAARRGQPPTPPPFR